MQIKFEKVNETKSGISEIILIDSVADLMGCGVSELELNYIKNRMDNEDHFVAINQYLQWFFVFVTDQKKPYFEQTEAARKAADKMLTLIKDNKITTLAIRNLSKTAKLELAFAEGLVLGSYQFLKYQTKEIEKKINPLSEIQFISEIDLADLTQLSILCKAVYSSRTLINEPVSYLTSSKLSEEIEKLSTEAGFSLKVLRKAEIQDLKMGGLLAVNQGSTEPPTFNILEWNPENAKNPKPIILVGKGLTYDTGGLSLKPTKDSMDYMKCDMSGAATVSGVLYAVASLKLPLHVIGLIPSTDNRLSADSYAPGDVITMFDGTTVEVLNTDAEGRLILADALSYAQHYSPELVMDFATLTGAAAMLIGNKAACLLSNLPEELVLKIKKSGFDTFERVIELPIWEDFFDGLKSGIADMANVAGPKAGTITATKFLEKFTNYPWAHFDIAGPAYVHGRDSYRGVGGTGYGVRLITDFLQKLYV